MASVTFNICELTGLVGKKLSNEQLEEVLTSIGAPVDEINEQDVTVDVTPDRLDFLSVEGVARAISSFLSIKKGLRYYRVEKSGEAIEVDESVASVRPSIVGAFIRGMKIDDQMLLSLMHVQEKIHETYGRKRKKVSIGIHNADAVKPPFVYKAVSPEEVSFTPLDMNEKMNLREILEKHPKGRDYAFTLSGFSKYPVVVDAEDNVLSFPPIINGELTRVGKTTKNLFIEVTGTSLPAAKDVLNAVCTALADRGGKIESIHVDGMETPDLSPKMMSLDLAFANKVLGFDFDSKKACELLERMGFDARGKESLEVLVPSYRVDVLHEVDLVEDIAIAFGYNNFEPLLPQFSTIGKSVDGFEATRSTLIGLGFLETINNTLTNEENNFTKMLLEKSACTEIANPLTVDYTVFRTWLTPSLLQVFSRNKHEPSPQKIFEIGTVANEKGETTQKIAVATSDSQATFSQIKSIAESLLCELDAKYAIVASEHPSFIKGRCASVKIEGKVAGLLGEIHPRVLENFQLEQPVSVLEIQLE